MVYLEPPKIKIFCMFLGGLGDGDLLMLWASPVICKKNFEFYAQYDFYRAS